MNSKKLSINFISNIIQFITSLIISFFFTPYIISSVGETGYGFYSLACTCISYFTVLATAMNSMASRFITVEYHKNCNEKVKSYYASTFYANLFIGFLFSIIIILCVGKIDSILNVPTDIIQDVKGMFYFVLFAGLFSSVTAVFSSTVFCLDRLDVKAIAMVFISIIKVVILYCLLRFTNAKLLYLGIAYSVSIVLEALVYIITTIKMMPIVNLSIKDFKLSSVKTLVGAGIWNSVNQINTILSNGLDLLLANLLISPVMAGILGVSKTIPNQLMSLLIMLANIFLPSLTIAYSKKNKTDIKNIFQTSFDVLGIFMGIVMAGFVVLGRDFFMLWMPESSPELLYVLSILGMLSFLSIGSTQCMGNAALLANKLKLPVLITLARNIVGVGVIWLLSILFDEYAVYFIAVVSPISIILFEVLFNVPFSAKCIDVEKWFFYKNKIKFLINVIILIVMFYVIKLIALRNVSWLFLILSIGLCGMCGLTFNFFFYFDKEKRKNTFIKIKSIIKKITTKKSNQ